MKSSPLWKNKDRSDFGFRFFLLLGNSMLKFDLWENIIITMSVLFFMLLLYQQIFEAKK